MRASWIAACVAALALSAGCNKSKNEAVPAEVDVEWPDASGFPPAVKKAPPDPDAAAQSAPDPGPVEPASAPEAPPAGSTAPSMSTGSDG